MARKWHEVEAAATIESEIVWTGERGERTNYAIGHADGRYYFRWSDSSIDAEVPCADVDDGDNGISWFSSLAGAVTAATECFECFEDDPEWAEAIIASLPTPALRVQYSSGESRKHPGQAVDYMLADVEDIELYAEMEPVEGDETATYEALAAEVLCQAVAAGIDLTRLQWHMHAPLLTVAQAADILGLSVRRVQQLCTEGRLGRKVGRDYIISVADIEANRVRPTRGRPRSWKRFELAFGSGDELTFDGDPAAYCRAMAEFRRSGGIGGIFFARLGLAHEDPDDASTWGPQSPRDVDWTGFDEGRAVAGRPIYLGSIRHNMGMGTGRVRLYWRTDGYIYTGDGERAEVCPRQETWEDAADAALTIWSGPTWDMRASARVSRLYGGIVRR